LLFARKWRGLSAFEVLMMGRLDLSAGGFLSAAFFCLASLLQTTQITKADDAACVARISAQGRTVAAREFKLAAQLKRTGNCALVQPILEANDQFSALCHRMVSECGGWCRQPNSRESYVKRLRAQCHDTTVATGTQQQKVVSAPSPPAPPQQQAAASPPATASCGSDITGTDNASPAPNASDCKDARRSLNAARQLRKQKQFSLLAPEEYKKAAAAAQRAGDTELMLKIIQEAGQPDAPTTDKPDPYKEGLVRSANAMIGGAQEILSKPATCSDMKDAAAMYLSAARSFLDADEFVKTNEMNDKHNAVAERVDRLEAEGKCHSPQPSAKQPATPTVNNQAADPAVCQRALDRLKKIDEQSANMASIGEPAGRNGGIVVARMKLAAEGCIAPDAQPYSLRECIGARLSMTEEKTPANEVSAIVERAGCPK
jgi:hypothetical protein